MLTRRDGAEGGVWCGARGAALLVLLCLSVYLPGFFTIPPVDRDESRFAQASRQMLESVALPPAQRDPALHAGGLLVPRVGERARLTKPPLIYWLQAGAAGLFTLGNPLRDAIWMYRVPSLLAAIVAVLATWRLAGRMMGPAAAWLGGAMLAVCPILVWEAHQARADALLLACTTLAMLGLHRTWRSATHDSKPKSQDSGLNTQDSAPPLHTSRLEPQAFPWLFWLAMAAGVLAKGPITPLVAGLAVVGLGVVSRRWGWIWRLRPVAGSAVVVAALGAWATLVAGRVGWGTLWETAVAETLARSASPREGHWGPPGYHTLLSAMLFWPGSLLTLAAVAHAWHRAGILEPGGGGRLTALARRWRHRPEGDTDALFLVAWLVPSWLVFEAIMTKLPHYTLPLYPALALATALAIDRMLANRAGAIDAASQRVGAIVWAGIGLAWLAAAPVALALLAPGPVRVAGWGAAAAGAAAVAGATVLFFRARVIPAHVSAVGGTIVFVAVCLGVLLPRAETLWVSDRLAGALGDHTGPVAALGYHEDSLVFHTRARLIRLPDIETARGWLALHPGGALIAPAHEADTIEGVRQTGAVAGFNYSNGRRVDLRIVRPWPPAQNLP